jgi:hypothetical protein
LPVRYPDGAPVTVGVPCSRLMSVGVVGQAVVLFAVGVLILVDGGAFAA